MKESVTYQMILEEGVAKGFAKGRAETLQNVIFRLAAPRFGAPDPSVEVAVRAIHDSDRLDRIVDRVAAASSWQALLNTP
jgi:hypothetical protein